MYLVHMVTGFRLSTGKHPGAGGESQVYISHSSGSGVSSHSRNSEGDTVSSEAIKHGANVMRKRGRTSVAENRSNLSRQTSRVTCVVDAFN